MTNDTILINLFIFVHYMKNNILKNEKKTKRK